MYGLSEFFGDSDVSLFKNKNHQISESIILRSSRVRPILCVCNTGVDQNLNRAEGSAPRWLDSIRKCYVQDICSVYDTKVKASLTITFHLRVCESQTRLNFDVVNELVVHMFLGTLYIDRFIKLIHLAERKFFRYYSAPVLILTAYHARSQTETD